jgi:flagellar hook-associated protein 1 FlgK
MIGAAITSALAGLQAATRRTEVASRNVAGGTVDGYVRKEARFGSGPAGLAYQGIIRATDLSLMREAGRERSGLAGMEAELTSRTALVERLGDPRTGNDLGSSLTPLSQALTQLGNRPDDPVLQNEVVDNAGETARFLRSLTEQVQNERLLAQQSIATDVADVNDRLHAIADLNQQIVRVPDDADASDLLDARDKAIGGLMELLPVRTMERANGELAVLTDTGVTLLDGSVHELRFTPGQAMGPDMAYSKDGTGKLSGLFVDGADITPGSGASQALRTGRLAGNFAVRDQAMPQAQQQLDQLASALVRAFQEADATITDPATQRGLFVDRASDTGTVTVTGLAGRLAVNPEVDPAQDGETWRVRTGLYASGPGDIGEGNQVRDFAAVFSKTYTFDAKAGLATQASLVSYANQLTDFQQSQKSNLDAKADYQQSLVTSLDARLADNQGVDLDKELQDIMLFEKSYAASASVLTTAMRMLDELLESV